MSKLEKALALVLTLSLVGLALLTLSLGGELKALLTKLSDKSFAGVTNYDEVAAGAMATRFEALELGAGASTTAYTNRTGATQFARLAQVTTTGTASSSFDYFLLASSSSQIPGQHAETDVVMDANARILFGTVATGTTATTTNNILGAIMGRNDAFVAIPNGHSVLFGLQRGDHTCVMIPSNLGCEQATSTNRGFNLSATLELLSTSTQRQ